MCIVKSKSSNKVLCVRRSILYRPIARGPKLLLMLMSYAVIMEITGQIEKPAYIHNYSEYAEHNIIA